MISTKDTPSSVSLPRFEEPFLDAGLAFLASQLEGLFHRSVTPKINGFVFTVPNTPNWEEQVFSRLVEQRERRLRYTSESKAAKGKLVSRPVPGAAGHARWGHPVFGKGSPGKTEREQFVPLLRQAIGLDMGTQAFETCGVTGDAFLPHGEVYQGRQSVYPFMVDQKKNLGGVRQFDFCYRQSVILAALCSWMASVPLITFYRERVPVTFMFYPVVPTFASNVEIERKFATLLQFDHHWRGSLVAPGFSPGPYAALISLYERYRLDAKRVLPCDRWFVLRVGKEGQGYDIRAFERTIPSLEEFDHFFASLPGQSPKEPFELGRWISRLWIRALDPKSKESERYQDARERFPEWVDDIARAFLENKFLLFLNAFSRMECGYVLYVRNSSRNELFEVFWTLISRFAGGSSMDQEFRTGVEAFGRALSYFSWQGRSTGGRKDLSHHYKIARSGSYRSLVEALTDAIAGMMAASEASGSRFRFDQKARGFCDWLVAHMGSTEFNQDNWWTVKAILVAAMNMAAVHREKPEDEKFEELGEEMTPDQEEEEEKV
ncbi:MAG: hypothetical protein AB7G68_10425 [Nitrospiraceae bacterium]